MGKGCAPMYTTLLAVAIMFFATPAFAQFLIPGAGNDVTINFSPAHPTPGNTVQLTAQSTLYDLNADTLTWSAGGKTIAQGVGVTQASVTAGALGSETDVTVDVEGEGSASAVARIIPSAIDLLWESDSYTPPLYRGRALPSAGTSLRLQAIPYISQPGMGALASSHLVYTWKRNGQVIGSVSGRGASSVIIDAPTLFGSDTISVEAASTDGTLAADASVIIPSVEPQLALYEDHPLFGVMYHQALGSSTFIPETEMTFAAVPYFADARGLNDPFLQYAWRVNQSDVAADQAQPNEITIDAAKSNGLALIGLSLTHMTNFFLSAEQSWGITFTSAESGSGGSSASDPFHTN